MAIVCNIGTLNAILICDLLKDFLHFVVCCRLEDHHQTIFYWRVDVGSKFLFEHGPYSTDLALFY